MGRGPYKRSTLLGGHLVRYDNDIITTKAELLFNSGVLFFGEQENFSLIIVEQVEVLIVRLREDNSLASAFFKYLRHTLAIRASRAACFLTHYMIEQVLITHFI